MVKINENPVRIAKQSIKINKVICTALFGLISKETWRILRIWPQTLLPSAVSSTLYFLIFGNLIGQRIGEIQGVPYIAFIVPGIILMSVITNSYGNVSSSFFSCKFMLNVEVMLVAPVPSWVILVGYVGGGMVRGCTVGLLVGLVAQFYTQIQPFSIGIMLLIIMMTSLVFSLAGFTNALLAKRFDEISIVPVFILMPLTYLGGVFYSVSMLPDFFRRLAYANPILYMINAFRYGVFGQSDIDIVYSISLLFVFVLFFFFLALSLLHKGTGLRS